MSRLPDFLIIGAMKCATSTLHEQLALQPGIFMSTPKEPNFFSDEEIFARGMEWYEELFATGARAQLCGESSTHYTKLPTHPQAADRIAQHLPEARLVYVMRDPIARLVSHYRHEWTQRTLEGPIETAIHEHPELVAYGCYAMQLQPYLERFGPGRVLPVFAERLERHPQRELERVCGFLGYAGRPSWDAARGRRNAGRKRLRRNPWRDAVVEAPLLAPLRRRLVPRRVRERIKSLWRMETPPALPDACRKELEARFNADLALLGRWLGRELACGRFDALVEGPAPEWTTAAGERG